MRFQQRFGETFSEAWDRFIDLLNKCPNHGFSSLYQIDTFYNSLNQSEQDSLNSAANGNFLIKNTQEALTIIENKSKVQTSRNKTQVSSASGSSAQDAHVTALTKQVEALVSSMNRPVNSIQNGCETCGGPRAYYECQAVDYYTQDVPTESTIRVLPPVVQSPPTPVSFEIPPTSFSSEISKRNPHQPPVPYLSRLNKEKLQDKSDIQIHKFLQMFKKLHFNNSLAEALALMPKYTKFLKDLLSDKEKLLGLANTSLTENCSAVLLKKLPEKLGDPGRFLIPCDFHGLESCMALSNLATQTVAYPASIAEDVYVQSRVYGEELILRDGDENLIFHADSTSKHPHKHGNESITMIKFIDITCEDRFLEVLKIKKLNHPSSGSTLSLSNYFSSLTPFKTSDYLLEEFADELAIIDPFLSGNEDDNFDPEADLRKIEYLLNQDPSTESSPKSDIEIIGPIPERFTDNLLSLLTSDSTLPEESFESSKIATLLSSPFENGDKVFNPSILILGRTQIFNDESKDKDFKVNTSTEALLILEECNFLSISSDQELLSHFELSVTETLLSFSSENKDKVFNPGNTHFKRVHSFTLGYSSTYETFKNELKFIIIILNKGPMKIFPFFCICPKDKGIRGESS
ncbi:hypothetical protein Tco_0929438 [Tanacetum coccineum]